MLKTPKLPTLNFQALKALAADATTAVSKTASAQSSSSTSAPCSCAASDSTGWISSPASLSDSDFQEVGTLLQDPFVEPTFAEFHPDGTRYDSPDAPIAPRYFPYNRCTVSTCKKCGRAYLRYTEAGGYFVDRRIRALSVEKLVDAKVED
ncbi:MAG: hypothetical protein QE278_06620 [Limnobacter sp.]|nr:hypothetical protein [Limnobacter sp.]